MRAMPQRVENAVQAVTGTADPTAAMAALNGKPELAIQLRTELAKIAAEHQAELDTLKANLADIADARRQTIELAKEKSPLAFGAPLVSAPVLIWFAVVITVVLLVPIQPASEAVLNILLGTLAGMAMSVVSYWVGSSAGSADKARDLSVALASAHAALANATGAGGSLQTSDDLNAAEITRIQQQKAR